MRKAFHQFKEARAERFGSGRAAAAEHYYSCMLLAAEAVLLLHGENLRQPQEIIEGLRRHLTDDEYFPEEAVVWLEEAGRLLERVREGRPPRGSDLDDLDDRAEKLMVAAENIIL